VHFLGHWSPVTLAETSEHGGMLVLHSVGGVFGTPIPGSVLSVAEQAWGRIPWHLRPTRQRCGGVTQIDYVLESETGLKGMDLQVG
jgi:hypothetical protein